jgi:hypothetical protein
MLNAALQGLVVLSVIMFNVVVLRVLSSYLVCLYGVLLCSMALW